MVNFRHLFETKFERLRVFFSAEEYGESRRERTVKKLISTWSVMLVRTFQLPANRVIGMEGGACQKLSIL